MTIFIIVLILLAIPFIGALFMDESYTIEREISISRPLRSVFDYVRLLKNAEHYNKWVMMDPGMQKSYRGTDGMAGFIYDWDSKNKQVGKGEQEITRIMDQQRIDYTIRFFRPFQGLAGAAIITSPLSENQTRVQWLFEGKRSYGMRVTHLVLNLKKTLGRDLQTSLENLKRVLEK
jgi:uncharacterized protein YndB with AHSA1/START domain